MKNPTKNCLKNAVKNRYDKKTASPPEKGAFSANKGSDLLRFPRNNSNAAGGRPTTQPSNVCPAAPSPLHEGQVVYLHRQRRRL